jgi:hypothetical protein
MGGPVLVEGKGVTRSEVSAELGVQLLCLALFLFAALGAASCKRRQGPGAGVTEAPRPPPPPPPALGDVLVEDVTVSETRPDGVRLDAAALAAGLRRRLEGASVFVAHRDAGAGAVARVRVEVAIEEVRAGGKAAARAVARLRVQLRPEGAAARQFREDVQAGSETVFSLEQKLARQELFQRLVARTLDDLAAPYLARLRLWAGPLAALDTALRSDAGEQRLEAIRIAGERGRNEAVPALLRLLEDPDEVTRDAALGALVDLRSKEAVSVLGRKRELRDRREMRKILDAMAAIGGEEASDYLTFVAVSHEDEEIREMAASARGRLDRRGDAMPAGPSSPAGMRRRRDGLNGPL